MKKILFSALTIVLAACSLFAQLSPAHIFSLKAGATYFYPSEQSLKSIYGNGPGWGGEINLKIWRFIDLWMIGNFFDKKGNLPYTKEPTEISLITFGGGVKFRLTTDPLSIYLGGGPALCSYKESNPIGVARGNGPGFIGQLGLYFRIVGGLIIDIAADYTSFKVKPKTIKADLGGAKAGIRIGYVF